MIKLLVNSVCFIFFIFYIHCQNRIGIEVGSKLGIMIPHRPIMKHLPKELIYGFDFNLYKIVSGKKNWHEIYNYPKIGLGFYYSNLGNDQILGEAFGITPYIFFPFSQNEHNQFGLNLRLGIGRVSKPFNLETNTQNVALSSYLNCLAIGGLEYQYKFDKTSFGSRIELTHLSNAALKAPNLGINMLQGSLFVGYKFSKNKLQIETIKNGLKTDNSKPRNYVYFIGFIGQKQLYNHLGENYKIQGGTIAYQHLFSLPIGVEIGFDLINNTSDLKLLEDKGLEVKNVLKFGSYLGYVLSLENFHFLVSMGYYIHDRFNLNDKFYHRVGIRYTFLNRFLINCTLKSHWGNADYLELGLGMRFGK